MAFVGKEIYEKVKPKDRLKYYYPFQDMNIRNKLLKRFFFYLNRIILLIQKKVGINRIKKENLSIGYGTNWLGIMCDLIDYILSKKDDIERLYRNSFFVTRCLFIHLLLTVYLKKFI